MKIKIIIPIYPLSIEEDVDFSYPENYKTPFQQFEWLRKIINDKEINSKEELVIVTTSPYIAKGLCNFTDAIKDGDNFGLKPEIVFSDGKDILTSEQFFYHFAEVMRLLIDDITPKN